MPDYAECANLLVQGVVAKADADIAGLGVIYAFTISAAVTLFVVCAAYFAGLVDAGLLGAVDRIVMHIPTRAPQHQKVHVTLRKAIMACSDQQIVTGIAILAAGFHGLVTGHISVYHYNMVVYLAWMSSSVHLSALTLLKPFMQRHRGVLVWRCVGMLVLLVMLVIALVPTISNDWAIISLQDQNISDPNYVLPQKTVFGIPAICFWGQLYGDGVNPDAVLSYIVLFVSYVWKMGGLFPAVTSFWTCYVRNPLNCCLERPLSYTACKYAERRRPVYLIAYWIALAIYIETTALLEVLDSFSAALWLSTLGLIYGVLQIAVPRALVQSAVPGLEQGENEWGFGQLVPLVLLVQPLGAITEHLWLVDKDDDEVYLEDDTAAQASTLKFFEKRSSLPPARNISMLHYLSTYAVPKLNGSSPQRVRLQAILYTSKLFKFVVWAVHIATAATSGVLFYIDYQTIGWARSSNWQLIAFVIAGYLVAAPLIVFLLAPFSRLSRRLTRAGSSMTVQWPMDEQRASAIDQQGNAAKTQIMQWAEPSRSG